ncbi:MAG: hypothetical protein ABSH12_06120 [Endomicrobiales bacterium]
MKQMVLKVLFIPFIIAFFGMCAFSDYELDGKNYACWAGVGTFTGDVTYQIGSFFVDPTQQINQSIPFPVSKLQFPINVTIATVGNEYSINKNIDIRGELSKNITTFAGQQQDTDYLIPGVIQTYSSNDSDLQTITVDMGARYWLSKYDAENIHFKYGVGAAYLYEHLEWEMSNLNQFDYYDQNGNPYIPSIQTTQPGLIGTYATTTSMPYIELATELEKTNSFSVLLSLGYSPFAQISDEDDHILRQIDSTTNLVGSAYKICIQARYNLSEKLFLMGKWDWINYDLTGTENDQAYDGTRDYWTEGHEISSSQSILSLSLGAKF